MMEEALFARLTGNAAVHAVVGTKVYPVEAPEKVDRPYLVYRETSYAEERDFDQWEVNHSFRIDVHGPSTDNSPSYKETKALATLVREALRDNFNHEGLCVRNVIIGVQSDEFIRDLKQHAVSCSFTFVYDLKG